MINPEVFIFIFFKKQEVKIGNIFITPQQLYVLAETK